MSKKIKDEQKKFLGETLNQYDKALDEAINQLDKKNREQNHKISSLVNSFDNEYLEKDVEGNMTTLENSKDGMVIINEIQGNTEVNYCKDEKELVLNGDIDTQGESFVTITEGVDGGLVDVSLEGNTEVNLSKTKDPVLVTREFDDINCNVGKLQYTIDDVTTINDEPGKVDIDRIVGDTMVNHAVNGSEELILNANINESGDNNITLNGVTSDGGKVDVALEGNTLVNVSKTKDSTAITKAYTVENSGNHVALQGDIDGNCRPVVTGNTLVNCLDIKGNDNKSGNTAYSYVTDTEIVFDWSQGQIYNNWIQINNNLDLIQAGKTYTVVLNILENNPTLDGVNITGESIVTVWGKGFYGASVNISFGTTGLYKYTFSTVANSGQTLNRIGFMVHSKTSFDKDAEVLINGGKLRISKDILILEGDYTNKPIPEYFEGLQSSFEDKVVTQEMVDNGEELAENLGKYKVDYVISKEDGTVGQTKTFYLNSPLLKGDTIEQQGDNVVHVHRYGKVVLDGSSDEQWKITGTSPLAYLNISNKIQGSNTIICDTLKSTIIAGDSNNTNLGIYMFPNSSGSQIRIRLTTSDTIDSVKQYLQQNPITVVYKLATPQYEVISQNDTILCDSYTNGHLDVDSVVPIEKVDFLPFTDKLTYLYPSTQYAVQFVSDAVSKVDITLGGAKLLNQDVKVGTNKYTITTPSELIDNNLVLNGEGFNASNIVVTEATDQEFGYFEGMKSVGECEDLAITSSNSDGTSSNTQTLTYEPLRAVGDIKDKYVLIDGKWYIERKCRKVVFDGSDVSKITYYPDNSTNNTAIFTIKVDNGKNGGLCLCDKFINFSGNIWNVAERNDKECISSTVSDLGIILSISKYKLSSVNPDGLGLYLQSNPIIVVYELQTPTYEPINYIPLEVYSGITHITTNSAIPTNIIIKNHGYNLVALKENTQYTLYVNKNTTNALTYRLGDYVEINSLNKFTFTTPSTLTDKTLRIDGKGTKVNDLMLIEGTPTNDSIGYFDGLKSSYECEQVTDENDVNYGKYKVDVKVVGKNLFDKNKFINAELCTFNGIECVKVQDTGKYFKYYDNFKHNTQYTLTLKVYREESYIDRYFNVVIEYTDGTEYKVGLKPSQLKTITTDQNKTINYIHGEWMFGGNGYIDLSVAQLEEGDTATEYEPYFESIQTVYLNSPLLKGDEIVWKDNKIQHYHKMETIVLDGSDDENWLKQGNDWDTDNRITFKISLPKSNLQWWTLQNEISTAQNRMSKKVLSDKFTYIYNIPNENINEFIGQDGNIAIGTRHLVIGLSKNKLQTQDVTGFKQWLQQNPITVAYQLAEPTYEEISDYPLKLNAIANSSLSTESTIQVTNISFNVYEETLPYLYPNTKYYITFNADVDRNNIVIDLGGNHVVFDCKVGFNKVEITTPNDTTNLLTFSGTGVNIDHVKVTQQDIDKYFEGMKSVGECESNVIEIVSQNKNLFDGTFISGNVAPNGEITPYADRVVTPNYLKINPNVPLFIHGFDNIAYICYYDSDKNVIVRNTYAKDNRPLVNYVPSNAMYIRISIVECTDTSLPMIVEQSIVTEGYVEHQSNTQTLTHEPLRAVGDVKDRYVLLDNKWYIERNCGYNNILRYYIINTNIKGVVVDFVGRKLNSHVICDSIKLGSPGTPGTFYVNPGNIVVVFDKNDPITDEDMIAKVSQYNFISQLATPVYEELDYNPFEVYSGITHISANSLIPTNVVVKNTGYNCILKPSTKYTVALNKPNGTISAKLGGSAKVDSTNSIFTITTPSTLNDNVLRLSGSGNVKDIMILEGDKTINTPSYFKGIESVFEQEYDVEKGKYRVTARVEGNGKESNITFYIDEPLRGIKGVRDRVYIQDNKVVVQRNCTSAIFDGSEDENWRSYSGNVTPNSYGIVEFSLPFSILNISQWYEGLCDTFNVRGHSNVINKEAIGLNGYGRLIFIDMLVSKLSDISVDGFKQWLQQNPVTVVYKLSEPIYEEVDCDLSKLVLENYKNSSLIFESNIPVSANIRYSGEVPVVTQAKSLSSQVDNTTLDINENIIPYMCDIDYRIVELQLMNGDTQGEGIELLGIGDIEILGNENVLFNNREDKKYNYSYDMLKRDILSQRYSKEEYQYRLDRYLLAKKISDEEYKELEGLLNNGE